MSRVTPNSATADISVVDCTLRDGAHVNGGDFGDETIKKLGQRLPPCGVDLVEIGFIVPTAREQGSTYFDSPATAQAVVEPIDDDCALALMTRPDWLPLRDLDGPTSHIQTLRVAFRERDLESALNMAQGAVDLGYQVHLNPIATPTFEPGNLEACLTSASSIPVEAVTIVDTYGSLNPAEMLGLYKMYDANLPEDVTIGVHLHENLSLAQALARIAIGEAQVSGRRVSVDGSLLGMGRAPGNLPTELLVHLVSELSDKIFDLEEIFQLVWDSISPLRQIFQWGYHPVYALSALHGIDRTYAEVALRLGVTDAGLLSSLFSEIASEGKLEFDEDRLVRAMSV